MDQRTSANAFGRTEYRGIIADRPMSELEAKTQLDLLRDEVLLLGGKTEEAVHRAVRSLTLRDSELARSVCDDDQAIDQMELEIDRLAVDILGTQALNERDLRLVVS